MSRSGMPLPRHLVVPFLRDNLDGFDFTLEDGERIVITPKDGAQMTELSVDHLRHALTAPVTRASIAPPARPKFIYHVKNAGYTPEQAKAFGMSKPRLHIYSLVYAAGKDGVGYKDIRAKANMGHGSVMQVLNWLRKQQLITGQPDKS